MANGRCVECGKIEADHGPSKLCYPDKPARSSMKFGTMDLPDGKTCDDCARFRFCSQFIGPEISGNTSCDWFPIRFIPGGRQRQTESPQAPAGGKE